MGLEALLISTRPLQRSLKPAVLPVSLRLMRIGRVDAYACCWARAAPETTGKMSVTARVRLSLKGRDMHAVSNGTTLTHQSVLMS
jgi:hypothetical protein